MVLLIFLRWHLLPNKLNKVLANYLIYEHINCYLIGLEFRKQKKIKTHFAQFQTTGEISWMNKKNNKNF